MGWSLIYAFFYNLTLIIMLKKLPIGLGCVLGILILGAIFISCFYFYNLYDYGYTSFLPITSEKSIALYANQATFIAGILGPIFTLLSVFVYYSALKLQEKQIEAQAKQIEAQAKDAKDTRLQVRLQQFETTFFNLLKTKQEIKENISGSFFDISFHYSDVRIKEKKKSSDDFFTQSRKELIILYFALKRNKYYSWNDNENLDDVNNQIEVIRHNYQDEPYPDMDEDMDKEINVLIILAKHTYIFARYNIMESGYTKCKDSDKRKAKRAYAAYHVKYDNELSHYLRFVYNMFKYIDNEKETLILEFAGDENILQRESIETKFNTYVSFIQSSMSRSELFVFYYNSMLFNKSRKLYVKYNLFENLKIEYLIEKEHDKYIPDVTFKSNAELRENLYLDNDLD